MIITKDFYSMIEMNKYIEDNNIKSKDISYMGPYLNLNGFCMIHHTMFPIPKFSLQYENHETQSECYNSKTDVVVGIMSEVSE